MRNKSLSIPIPRSHTKGAKLVFYITYQKASSFWDPIKGKTTAKAEIRTNKPRAVGDWCKESALFRLEISRSRFTNSASRSLGGISLKLMVKPVLMLKLRCALTNIYGLCYNLNKDAQLTKPLKEKSFIVCFSEQGSPSVYQSSSCVTLCIALCEHQRTLLVVGPTSLLSQRVPLALCVLGLLNVELVPLSIGCRDETKMPSDSLILSHKTRAQEMLLSHLLSCLEEIYVFQLCSSHQLYHQGLFK